MRRLAISVLCLLFVLTAASHSQSSDQALKDFRAQILKQPLIPRGFSDDPVTTFQWNGKVLIFSEPKLHTFGVINATSVELKGNKLKISGKRQTLVRDTDGILRAVGDAHATLWVDLQGVDPAQALPPLKAALFFATPQDAVDAIPPENALIASANPPKMNYCSVEGQEVQQPKNLVPPALEMSTEARNVRATGRVGVSFTVNENGLPSDFWIVRPFGLGMEEKAIEAVMKEKNQPATCGGKPVKVTLFQEFTFAMQ